MIGPLHAIAPRIYSDEELAKFPIIVVGQWEKADFRSHIKESENEQGEAVVEQWETYTKLKIIRTLKGTGISPGEHELKIGFGISWDKEGKGLETGTSTQIPGDVDDVTKPRIWFLRKDRSWDPEIQREYLSVSNFRCVQDVVLEEFFMAAGSEKAGEKVAELLASNHRETVERALRFLCGAREPWPVGPGEDDPEVFYDFQSEGSKYPSAAARIREFAVKCRHEDLEPTFISAYAELVEEIDVRFLKTFLESEHVDSRVVAACYLIRKNQYSGLGALELGGARTDMLLRMISEIGKNKNLELVPLLIDQLENGDSVGCIGNNHFVPALKAKRVLSDLTGCVFPFDVGASKKAWAAARNENRARRIETISKLAPAVEKPFKAEIIGTSEKSLLRLTNISHLPSFIASKPSGISQSSPRMSAGGFSGKALETEYKLIAPGSFLDIPFEIERSLMLFPKEQRSVVIAFLDNGGEAGPRAWIGVVEASFGEEWKERRLEENVEELWPNGNLKMIGQTVNGERVGDWGFFNEQGDRIREVDYSNGGTAECNPKHPSNKGAGIRKKK